MKQAGREETALHILRGHPSSSQHSSSEAETETPVSVTQSYRARGGFHTHILKFGSYPHNFPTFWSLLYKTALSELLRFLPRSKSQMKMDFSNKCRESHHPARHHLSVRSSEKSPFLKKEKKKNFEIGNLVCRLYLILFKIIKQKQYSNLTKKKVVGFIRKNLYQ